MLFRVALQNYETRKTMKGKPKKAQIRMRRQIGTRGTKHNTSGEGHAPGEEAGATAGRDAPRAQAETTTTNLDDSPDALRLGGGQGKGNVETACREGRSNRQTTRFKVCRCRRQLRRVERRGGTKKETSKLAASCAKKAADSGGWRPLNTLLPFRANQPRPP